MQRRSTPCGSVLSRPSLRPIDNPHGAVVAIPARSASPASPARSARSAGGQPAVGRVIPNPAVADPLIHRATDRECTPPPSAATIDSMSQPARDLYDSQVNDHPPVGEQLRAALRHARRASGESQRALAGRLDIPKSTIARWEAGDPAGSLRQFETGLGQLGFRAGLIHVHTCAPKEVASHLRSRHPVAARRLEEPNCEYWQEDGIPEFRDAAGRAFPAHGLADVFRYPPDYWVCRHNWDYYRRDVPLWRHRQGGPY